MKRYDIEMMRGDTLMFRIVIGGEMDTPSAVRMTARYNVASSSTLFSVSLNNGITVSGNTYTVRVPPSATQNAVAGDYDYDVEFTFNNDVYTPLSGKLSIVADVSR